MILNELTKGIKILKMARLISLLERMPYLLNPLSILHLD